MSISPTPQNKRLSLFLSLSQLLSVFLSPLCSSLSALGLFHTPSLFLFSLMRVSIMFSFRIEDAVKVIRLSQGYQEEKRESPNRSNKNNSKIQASGGGSPPRARHSRLNEKTPVGPFENLVLLHCAVKKWVGWVGQRAAVGCLHKKSKQVNQF